MPHLRPNAIAGLILAAVSAATLSSCGFHYPTDRVNTIAAGQNNRDHSVDALGIRVLATAKGEGRLIGALANNNDEKASLDAVSSPDGTVTAASFKAVQVGPRAGVNLAEEDPIALTGDFTAGDVVRLELAFSTGETATLNVPVVKPCFQYTQVPTPSAAAGKGETDEPAQDASSEGAEHGEEGGDATFNCADKAPEPESAH